MYKYIIIVTLLLINFSESLKLPSYFTKCSLTSGTDSIRDCIMKNIADNLQMIVANGDEAFKIKNLNPMHIKKADLQTAPELIVHLTDASVGDFSSITIKEMKFNVAEHMFWMTFNMDRYFTTGDYKINGKILGADLIGDGVLTFNCSGCNVTFESTLDRLAKEDLLYYVLKDEIAHITPSFCKYELTNLFNGDKKRGDEMNKNLNDNWQELFKLANESLSGTLAALMTSVINGYLSQIPLNELFTA